MQAVYYPKEPISLRKDEQFLIKCFHDEYSLWFDTIKLDTKSDVQLTIEKFLNEEDEQSTKDIPLACATLVSRNRLSQINNKERHSMYLSVLEKVTIFKHENIFQ